MSKSSQSQPQSPLSVQSQVQSTVPGSSSTSRFITAYGPKVKVRLHFAPVGRTKQSFKDECDINIIMRRYEQTGVLDHVSGREPQYLDATAVEFQSAMEIIAAARSQFQSLPAKLRSFFDNDPARFVEFMESDPDREDLAELGVLTPEAVERMQASKAKAEAEKLLPPLPPAPNAATGTVASPSPTSTPSSSIPLVNKQ